VTVLFVALGAAIGAPLRYLTDRSLRRWHDPVFPVGTLVVNVTASLVLGLLAGLATHTPDWVATLVGSGFCGALSTYSTFSYENQQLVVTGARRAAGLNVALSVVAGLGAAALGWVLGAALR
jgi:fluoride exporter